MAALRDAGYRMTPQRAMIAESMHHLGGHVTAEAVLADVQRSHPYVDLSTVYRTLELFGQMGLVRVFTPASGPMKFEVAAEPHHHLVCVGCGAESALAADELVDLLAHLRDQHGFEAQLEHLAIPGRCQHCRQADGS
jgi:Fe2+ or Zn2+ uptake regulation protein